MCLKALDVKLTEYLGYLCKKGLGPGPIMHRVRISAAFANSKLMLATYVNDIYAVPG
jgi:hypothetical protein